MRRKLLLLCLSPDFGGLEQHVRDYARWLSDQPDVALTVALREHSRLHQSLAGLPAAFAFIAPTGRYFPWGDSRRLAQIVWHHGIEVIHMHWRKDLPMASFAKRRAPVRLVHTQHLLLAEKSKRDPYHRYIWGALDALICVSAETAARARRHFPLPASAIHVVHPGIAPLPASVLPGPPRFNVGVVGRILPAKGQMVALRACAELRRRGIAAQMVYAGEVQDAAYVEQLQACARETGVEVQWRGFVEPERAYADLDALAMCTDEETFGLVTVEALRRGLPVAGSDSGGTREILAGELSALLFPPGDQVRLADLLERIYRDAAWRDAMVAAGLRRAAAEFDAQTQFRRALELSLSAP